MPAVNVLIKPASSACNMRCSYCFYRDVSNHREHAFEGMLSLDAMERVIAAAMEYAEGICSFAFQGGEPTLAGLDFFREVLLLQKKHQRPGVEIHNAIQTNGLNLDEEWARFLAENHILVGLSLDGPAEIHDLNRKDAEGRGTWSRIMRTVRLFNRYGVAYNILCVVTGRNARSIQKIYNFYRKQGFRWLQFIPCLEPLGEERGNQLYSLTCEEYGEYLIRLFDLWFQDLKSGCYISIRHLDNWLAILMGRQPEACNMTGRCSVQFVVEGDGGVYPCGEGAGYAGGIMSAAVDGVRAAAFKPLTEILDALDPELVRGALSGEHFQEYFFANATDEAIVAKVKEILGL